MLRVRRLSGVSITQPHILPARLRLAPAMGGLCLLAAREASGFELRAIADGVVGQSCQSHERGVCT